MTVDELKETMNKVKVSEEMQAEIIRKVQVKSKEQKGMKSKKKILIAAVAATLVLGATAIGSGGIVSGWRGTSSSRPDFVSLPTAEECVRKTGYAPTLTETFGNGYRFKGGNVKSNEMFDENGERVEKYESLAFEYEKDGDRVVLSTEKFNTQNSVEGEIIATVDGTDISYYAYTNKVVPANYVMSEADKKAKETGELIFSYGSDEVEICRVQSVNWVKDDVSYQLLQIDGRLSENDLAEMAGELIND